MKKVDIFLLAVATASVFSQKAAAQLPDVSSADNPVWYYIQVQGDTDSVNPRAWQPWTKGDSTVLLTHSISGSLPAALPNGLYKVGLWLPDSFSSLQDNPAYCIKLATDNKAAAHWTDTGNTRTVNIVGVARVGAEPDNGNGATAAPAVSQKNIKVYAVDGYLRVEGTSAAPTVYNLMGGVVGAKGKLPAGVYIVRVEGIAVKVLVD